MIHEIGTDNTIYKVTLVSGFSEDSYLIKGNIIDIINMIIDNKNIYNLEKIKKYEDEKEYIENAIEKIIYFNKSNNNKKFNFLGGQYYKIYPEFTLHRPTFKMKQDN